MRKLETRTEKKRNNRRAETRRLQWRRQWQDAHDRYETWNRFLRWVERMAYAPAEDRAKVLDAFLAEEKTERVRRQLLAFKAKAWEGIVASHPAPWEQRPSGRRALSGRTRRPWGSAS